jgi:hypothetical protein
MTIDWTNPHTWIWIDVADDKGAVRGGNEPQLPLAARVDEKHVQARRQGDDRRAPHA